MDEVRPFPEALLVAIDFSPCSLRALDTALTWRRANSEITILHVLDSDLLRRMERAGVGVPSDLMSRMRTRAEEELAQLIKEKAQRQLETMVVQGTPFVEIVKIGNDLDCDLIIIGRHGRESGLKELLFGGTAEQVLRGSNRPVLCIP